jgi:hypothetical protein
MSVARHAIRHAILAALASLVAPAGAVADPAQVLDQFGFFGRWSPNCDQAPAPDNVLRTSWVAAGVARFREQIGAGRGESLYVVLNAERTAEDSLAIRIQLNQAVLEDLVMVRNGDRMRTMSNQIVASDRTAGGGAGRVLVKDGVVTANGVATPWLARCK